MHSKIIAEEYICDTCGQKFNSFWSCQKHEKEKHVCAYCKHHYYALDWEFNCSLENKGQKCCFEPEEESKCVKIKNL